ncbi:probable signal peptidase complex subunit 2 isoform X2 [Lingula anatina]|uniref:Signal peptidase complex subunit 2 n=1 Tax=Lingula anatina TaxID=7574 RepID=A0A1S3K0P0_LINAN|nr:probable signal peptidase complex subunit 2 isoform X2 [Lingula anatina]|eukprot:XP_013415934.1 probable signal peptidase complex subunit 2 isoform X2 [Lingula anatina]
MAPKEGVLSQSQEKEWSADEKPVKIDKWDGSAVKNALDDAAKKVLTDGYGYVESYRLVDGRLGICTVAVAFAAFALLWDYLHPFPQSKPVLIVCVCSYFLLMGVLTVYTTYKEKGIFMVALDKDKAGVDPDNEWTLSSTLKRYESDYTLQISYYDGQSRQSRSLETTHCVADFIDENGQICMDLFEPEVKKMHVSLSSEKKSK